MFAFVLVGTIVLVLLFLFSSVALLAIVLGTAAGMDTDVELGDKNEDRPSSRRD